MNYYYIIIIKSVLFRKVVSEKLLFLLRNLSMVGLDVLTLPWSVIHRNWKSQSTQTFECDHFEISRFLAIASSRNTLYCFFLN